MLSHSQKKKILLGTELGFIKNTNTLINFGILRKIASTL